MASEREGLTFWDHLDVLRGAIIRIIAVILACAVVAFIFKDALFNVLLAPKNDSFIFYRLLSHLGEAFSFDAMPGFSVELINTGLARQFMVHMQAALCVGVVCASPYIIFEIFRFVLPALYEEERRLAMLVAGSGYVMFAIGVAIGYFIIFPLTFRFLGTYQVSGEVANMITLDSYMSTLMLLCVTMGVMSELPVICGVLARLGFISAPFMRRYRRHAIVLILVAAAVITPTSDVVTLLAVSLPIWMVYELGIVVAARTGRETRLVATPA